MTKDNTFGNLLQKLRQDKGLSQRQLANQVDVIPTYMSKIERGEFPPPSEKVIKKIASILDYDVDEFLAVADKVDSELLSIIKSSPKIYAAMLRTRKKDNNGG
ncbi:MAG: helix-turn-helix transcriptional regulator [Alphaproteobacteria bacterium]|jgi:transcriptional regulator with XRE-family HTH domain|nr:helix-turn-helix transcriptional regulator [Alphaproteobacteria bacterium]